MRGKGMVSRMWGMPAIQAVVRSMPRPKPPWGTLPYLRRSRYQRKASSGSLFSRSRWSSRSWSWMRWLPPMISPVPFGRDHIHAKGELGPLRVGLHVESFGLGRIAVDDDRLLDALGKRRLVGPAQVFSPGEL